MYGAISPDMILGFECCVCRSSLTRSMGATTVFKLPWDASGGQVQGRDKVRQEVLQARLCRGRSPRT